MRALVRVLVGVVIVFASVSPQVSTAGPVGTLEQISPVPTTYVQDVDFRTFENNYFKGRATGLLEAVDIGSADSGCDPADFAAFGAGNIALIKRGVCFFSDKVNNAALAGAIAAIIFDHIPSFPGVTFQDPTTIPAVFTTQALGLELLGLLAVGPVTVRVAVPEPATLLLLGAGLVGLAAASWRKHRQR